MSNLKLIIMVLDEVKKMRVSCIYRITFPDGKYYVGKTKNLRERVRLYERKLVDSSDKSRVMSALRDFGIGNVSWDILSCVDVRDVDDLELCLSILEIKYIRENDCIYPNGYNTSIGGELLCIPSDVIETRFGVKSGDFASKSVLAYDIDGNFVAEYSSVNKCAYELGVEENRVKDVLGKVRLLKNTYMLREKKYSEVPQKILPFKPEVVIKRKTEYDVVKEKVYVQKDVKNAAIMYDRNGNYVGLFDNVRKSRQYLKMEDTKLPFGREYRGMYLFHYNGGEIKKSLGAFSSKNLTTMFYDDILAFGDVDDIGERISLKLEEKEVKPQKEKVAKSVVVRKKKPRIVKYTLDGNYIATYDTTVDAAADNNVYPSAVLACAKKKVRRCGSYIYRFEGDDLDLPTFSDVTLRQRMPIQRELFD